MKFLKFVARSDWSEQFLEELQVLYACMDAYLSFQIGRKLINAYWPFSCVGVSTVFVLSLCFSFWQKWCAEDLENAADEYAFFFLGRMLHMRMFLRAFLCFVLRDFPTCGYQIRDKPTCNHKI